MNIVLKLVIIFFIFIGCQSNKNKSKLNDFEINSVNLKKDLIIAHRGSTYWTPEETEPAYRWARNIGVDYLELDLQLTKDSILVAFHDNDLKRTTNIKDIFPDRIDETIHDFTLKELRSLDIGSWFNLTNPDRAKESYINQSILTLQDVIMIAEGFRIKRTDEGISVEELIDKAWTGNYLYEIDPQDNGNRPGIYLETKHPKLAVEKLLADELTSLGWNLNTSLKTIQTKDNRVGVANTKARVILQSFSSESIQQLEKYLPNIPKCFLLWKDDMKGELKETYKQVIQFALNNHVQIIGTSIAGEPNNYKELTAIWMTDLIHNSGLQIHAYTFDTNQQLNEYQNRVEAVFTNRADLALSFYKRESKQSTERILTDLGY